MMSRQQHRLKGIALAEVLASVVLATIVLMGVFNSSFIALSASTQAEQSFDAENISASALADLRENHHSLGIPFNESYQVSKRAADYSVTRTLKPFSGYPYCAEAIVTVTWNQGRRNMKRQQKTVIEVKSGTGLGTGT